MNKPLAIELFSGLHGWGSGLAQTGFQCIGFDIVDMCKELGQPRPDHCELVLQNVLTLNGSQFKDAVLIVASPPCQFFSYCAMPWKRAKKLAADTRADPLVMEKELSLFNACFRIQREACWAAGRHIPLVVENVCGAQKWVGRAKWHYGSFYLWGDVPALMPSALAIKKGYVGGGSWFKEGNGSTVTGNHGRDNFGWSKDTPLRNNNSHSSARKAASAMIAKIPKPLAEWIGRVYYPEEKVA